MDLPTVMRWVQTHTSDGTCGICKLCGGTGWHRFSCGTPWRCTCNKSSALTPPWHPLYPYYVTDRQMPPATGQEGR